MIKIIAAITRDGGLGRQGQLLYHISADLKRFKELTMGHPIIMGRNTFESFPKGALPGRRNMVITTNNSYSAPGIETFPTLQAAIAAVGENDAFIIGGGRVYKEALPLAGELDLTLIDAPSPEDTDTYFPEIDPTEWHMTYQSDPEVDPRSGVTYQFVTLRR